MSEVGVRGHVAHASSGAPVETEAEPDGHDGPAGESTPKGPGHWGKLEVTLVATALALVALLAAGLVGAGVAKQWASPGDHSPEAGFARDMQTHHAQAVEMSLIIRDKTSDPTLRAVSYDIITAQQQQAGQMYGWLTQWGLNQTSPDGAMSWMDTTTSMSDMEGSATPEDAALQADGLMPGMASETEMDLLEAATGQEAERMFLTLMIKHHQGGIQMADAILEQTDRGEVVALASAIRSAQSTEIKQLTSLL
ncbi:hypothetical protein GCM10023153_27500 [Ornithinibacter aureus]|uniref:DUF305 domain-containing protein n=1 Tax=Ornithinibacter aureus TaxID=622664 RepID=A0ABP8K4X0_9MICO|nr:DUF305 domain-containing protein [Ornithinibacter aureus]KAF0834838.1 uncharacterized protein (DUF305 family) [Ornithinibacter aureus]